MIYLRQIILMRLAFQRYIMEMEDLVYITHNTGRFQKRGRNMIKKGKYLQKISFETFPHFHKITFIYILKLVKISGRHFLHLICFQVV